MSFFIKNLKQPAPLTIEKVFNSLIKISKTKGNNSQSDKQAILEQLLL